MAMVGENMANDIVDAMVSAGFYHNGAAPPSAGMITQIKVQQTVFFEAMITYLKANMGVKGIKTSTGTTLLNSPTPLVPVPTDGGAAVSAQMVANSASNILDQSNDGTGHIE